MAEEEEQHSSTAVEPGLDGARRRGTIGCRGTVGCLRFSVPTEGVCAVEVQFTPFRGGASVEPRLDLRNGGETKLRSLAAGHQTQSRLLAFPQEGSPVAVVQHEGQRDLDGSSVAAAPAHTVAAGVAVANRLKAAATSPLAGLEVAGSFEESLDGAACGYRPEPSDNTGQVLPARRCAFRLAPVCRAGVSRLQQPPRRSRKRRRGIQRLRIPRPT